MKQTRTTPNVENSKRRKEFIKRIGGPITPGELVRFADGTVGAYAGSRTFNNSGKIVSIGCYDIIKGKDVENYPNARQLPRTAHIGNAEYQIEVRSVEKPVVTEDRMGSANHRYW